MTNYDSVVQQLEGFGLDLSQSKPRSNGLVVGYHRPVRCKMVKGDREYRGWYRLHEVTRDDGQTILVGSYGVWHGNESNTQKVTVERGALSTEQAAALKKRLAEDRKQAEAEREREAERAAAEAGRVWRAYLPGEGESEYLLRKGVGAHGVRWAPSGNGTFAIPMTDTAGKVWGLQIIRGKDRGKKLEKEYFPRGLAKKGRFHLIGVIRDLVLVAEGYATAATLHEATGLPVAVAFDAGNLQPVAEAIKKTYKRARIIVCADDDYLTDGNPGCKAAETAALAVGCAWVKPQFITDRAGKKLTDFNDMAMLDGAKAVQAQIQAKVAEVAPGLPPALAGVSSQQGGGEDGARLSMMTPDEVVIRFSPVWSEEDVYYFDHVERVVVKRQSIANRMPRSAWDQVTTHPDWKLKPEVPLDRVDFDPSEADPNVVYNLWGGWHAIEASPECGCDGILDLLRHLCSHEKDKADEIFEWVLNWLAYPLQYPGAKMQSCILMHGGQGAGKNTVFDTMLEIYGQHAVEFGPSQLEKRFNALFSKKMFAIGNEVVASREDLYHVKGHIKHMITERRWVVEAKNKDERWERNCCNFVFLSNEINPQALDKGDRRHGVIWTPPVPDPIGQPDEWARWQKLWSRAHEERRNGGHAALYRFLMERDLEGFTEATWPPMTQAKQDLIDLNMDSRERFYTGWREEAIGGLPHIPVTSELLHEAYRVWTQKVGISRAVPMHSLMAYIGKQPNVVKRPDNIAKGVGYEKRTIVYPHFMHAPPPGKTKAAWLADCIAEFSEALDAYRG